MADFNVTYKRGNFLKPKNQGRHDTQHHDTQHNDTQHNDTQHYNNQHNDAQHNDTPQNNKNATLIITILSIMVLAT
jgi:hypothetical protein